MRREFWQSHDSSGYRARISIEWDTPRNVELQPERAAAAEEIADEVMRVLAPKPLEIVSAMMGRSKDGHSR